jgi:hypothetical protein
MTPPVMPAASTMPSGSCEIAVAFYCYGPTNGRLTFGGFGIRSYTRRFGARRSLATDDSGVLVVIRTRLDTAPLTRNVIPPDRFSLGVIIFTMVDNGRFADAFGRTRECTDERWWCTAMRAYTASFAGVWPTADSLWSSALQDMPEYERCAWLDPVWVADDREFGRNFEARSCAEKIEIAQRVWWLSDPFLTTPGNERRSEHLARAMELVLREYRDRRRRMNAAMLRAYKPLPDGNSLLRYLDPAVSRSRPPYVSTFHFGYTELIMRAGVPYYTAGVVEEPLVVAQYPFPRFSFVPAATAFSNHLNATPTDWSLHKPRPFEFMNRFHTDVREAPSQIAWFRRGDSARVVAASDISLDSIFRGDVPESHIVFQRDYDQPAQILRGTGGDVVRFHAEIPSDSTLVSIEMRTGAGRAARTRFGSGPRPRTDHRVSISDILLRAPLPATVSNLADAEPHALGTTTVKSGTELGLFWEVYGLIGGETPRMSVVLTRARSGLFGGILRAFSSRTVIDSLSVSWDASPASGYEIEGQSLVLSLRDLDPGDYTLAVRLSLPSLPPVISRRKVLVVR